MAINNFLADIAEKLGLKDSEISAKQKERAELENQIKNNQDKLTELAGEIANLEAQIRVKKREYEAATSVALKDIMKRELQTLLLAFNNKKEDKNLIADRIDADTAIMNKIDNIIFALQNPARTETVEATASDYDMVLDELKAENAAMEALKSLRYESTNKDLPQIEDIEKELTVKKDEQFEKELAQFE